MNSKDNIREKFWNGESSLEEERELEKRSVLESDLKSAESIYFKYLKEERKTKMPVTEVKSNQRYYYWSAIAASLVILALFGIGKWLQYTPSSPTEEDTFSDPEIAFIEAKKALIQVSASLKKSQDEIGKIGLISESEKIIKNQ